jgi:hypothetical protein
MTIIAIKLIKMKRFSAKRVDRSAGHGKVELW